MSEVFRIPLGEINTEISQENCDKWDSLAHLNFVMALEEELDIRLPADAVIKMIDFDSVRNTLMTVVNE